MASMKLETVGLQEFIEKAKGITSLDKQDMLEEVGKGWVGLIRSNIANSKNANGGKFAPVNYTKYRYDNGTGTRYSSKVKRTVNPLQDTGRLIGSFQVLNLNKNSVTVGSNLEYAEAHNKGLNGIKKRIMIPNKGTVGYLKFENKAAQIIELYIDNELKTKGLK